VSAHNLMTLIKRTSLIVYDADIFNCSRQQCPSVLCILGAPAKMSFFND